jgi:RNA polymerase sigma-70 factor (TIGR02943 family)
LEDVSASQIETWIDEYSDDFITWATYRLGDESLAKDMVQETFIAAYENLHQFKGESNPKTWLSRILRNKIVDYFRSAYHRKHVFEGSNDDETGESNFFDRNQHWQDGSFESQWEEEENLMDRADFQDLFKKCLADLPPLWRDIVAAKYFGKLKGEEISQDFNISASNYWQINHRAKLTLKKCLEVYWKL